MSAGLAASSAATAGGFSIPDIGTRRTGMAAVIGRPDDPTAVYHNPAGLTLQHGTHVFIAMGYADIGTSFNLHPWDQQPDGSYRSNTYLGATPGANGYYAPVQPSSSIGVIPIIAISTEVIPDKLWIAASTYVSNATGASFSQSDVTRYNLIDGYVIAPQAGISAAYKVNDKLSIGASIAAMDIIVHAKTELYPVLANGANLSGIIGTNAVLSLDGNAWAPTWNAGVLITPIPRLTIGAAIIGNVNASLTGPVKLQYGTDAPNPSDSMQGIQHTNQYLPWTWQGGANFDLTPNIEIGAECRYYFYKNFTDQLTTLDGLLIRSLDTVKDYHDSVQVSGGVRFHDFIKGLDIMMGTHYDHVPAPPDTVTLSSPSFNHYGLHSGFRYAWDRYRVALTYTRYWYQVPTVTNSLTVPPSNFQGTGVNDILTASFEMAFGGSSHVQ